jgi:hypothetical protein
MLAAFRFTVTMAASLAQGSSSPEEEGQEYIVQPGDWLSRISQRFYGDTSSWQIIVDATNAKAATDPRFTVIEDPDAIEVGQLLWIPNVPESGTDAELGESREAGGSEVVTSSVLDGDEAVSISVRFVEPHNGTVVPTRFNVAMEAQGVVVEPAGEIREGAGHFHILLDTDFVPPGELLPFDENHLHFGRGQLTTTLELEPGVHTLRLQLANGAHIALEGENYLDTITVTVALTQSVGTVVPSATVTTTVAPTTGETDDEANADSPNTDGTEVTLSPAVHFVAPQDGEVVTEGVEVTMAAEGLLVEPAGEIREGAGHFHLLLDTDFVPPGELLPFDENHLHFGRGQLTTTLQLEPGEHTLRLQFANGAHMALEGEQYRDEITITVRAGE